MPLWVPPPAAWNARQSNFSTPVANFGTVVTADVTTNTKNATYATLIASTNFDAYGIWITGSNVAQSGILTSLLVDIAIGDAGSETVIIPNLNFGGAVPSAAGNIIGGQKYYFPLFIPAGSRLSATAQAAISVDTVALAVTIYGQPSAPIWAGQDVTDYGTVLASSRGTSVSIGLSGAEGTFTEIVASTTQPCRYVAIGAGMGTAATTRADFNFMDVGVGDAAETVILENGMVGTNTSEQLVYPTGPSGEYCDVPAGQRLAVRISKTSTNAETRDIILYGVS